MGGVLTTERLVLRPVAENDRAALEAHWTEPHVRRFLFDGAVLSPAEIAGVVKASARSFAEAGYGLWLIRERGGAGLVEVLAEVDDGNTASVAVIERLGMTPFDVVTGELGAMTRYRTGTGATEAGGGSGR